MIFSVAKPEQAEFISLFVNSAYRGESSRRGWTTEADLLDGQRTDPEMIRNIIETEDNVILLGCSSEKVVACVHLTAEGGVCHLGMLTVSPELQNQGLGRLILEEAECYARSMDCREITMSVLAPRRELIDWYCRRGYVVTRETKAFPYGNLRFGHPNRKDLFFLVLNKNIG